MSHPCVIYWPPCVGNEETIASSQDIAQDSTVVINATDPNVPGVFKFDKIIRSINISSPDDIHNAHFIVSGIGTPIDADADLGNPTQVLGPITEDITGVNGGIVPSVNIFSQINSITVIGAPATNVTIGFGRFGITDYVFYDYNRMSSSLLSSATLQFINAPGLQEINAAVFISLNKPESVNISSGPVLEPFGKEAREQTPPLDAFIPAFTIVGPHEMATTITQAFSPFSLIWARIQDTSEIIQESLYFTFLQQGIK